MKKRLLLLLIAGTMAAGLLSGCGASENTQAQNNSEVQTETAVEETDTEIVTNTEIATETASDVVSGTETNSGEKLESEGSEGKTLVVYYSATGNTEEVANYIADATGGDLFELEPVEPYTSEDLDWTNDDSRVSREHEDESLRDVELVSTTVDGFEEYTTVYIGYPIWWGIAAWPVNQFVENNDFTGKTVIPFCTSSTSGIGDSGTLLEEMAGTGEWLEGERFRSGASEEDVVAWVESLDL